jgi:glycosyltransferase involved in cell wall biosynthesis
MAGISDVFLPESAFITAYSSVELNPDQILNRERDPVGKTGQIALIFVGSLAQMYKAPDILLQAMAKCVANGCNLRLKIVGDGRCRDMLQNMALQLGLGERCEFAGALPAGSAILHELDKADIFVLPSRTEGLPRAIIEAMARGLPCIGSTAGGIPELLQAEDLVPPGDVNALAGLIQEVAGNRARQRQMSIRNVAASRGYAESVLAPKRLEFYRVVKERSAQRLRKERLSRTDSGETGNAERTAQR